MIKDRFVTLLFVACVVLLSLWGYYGTEFSKHFSYQQDIVLYKYDPLPDNATFGVMYIVYGYEYDKYLAQVGMAVQSFKKMNPDIPVAVFSPAHTLNFTVEHQYLIPMNGPREWYTRIINLMNSPFDVTFSIDSQSISCAPIQVDLIMKQMREYDLLLRPKWCDARRRSGVIEPMGASILFRKSRPMMDLVSTWKKIHYRAGGHKKDTDDQTTLHTALRRHKDKIKYTMMPPHWFTFVQKSEVLGSPQERRSAIIREVPWLFHLPVDACSQFAAVTGPDPLGYQIVETGILHKYHISPVSTAHTCNTNVPCCSNTTDNIILEGMDL